MKTLLPLIIIVLTAPIALADNFFFEELPQPSIEWDKPLVTLQKHNTNSEIDVVTLYPEIAINYAHTSVPAINTTLNQFQNAFLNDTMGENNNLGEEVPSAKVFSKWANTFATEQWSLDDGTTNRPRWSISSTIHYQGHYNNLELFAIDGFRYTSGMQGGDGQTVYFVFTEQGKQLSFADILLSPDKLADIQPLLKPGMADYAKKYGINLDDDLKPSLFDKPKGNENFTFTAAGIKILYSIYDYDVAPYLVDSPYTILPYNTLKGIVKDEYLP